MEMKMIKASVEQALKNGALSIDSTFVLLQNLKKKYFTCDDTILSMLNTHPARELLIDIYNDQERHNDVLAAFPSFISVRDLKRSPNLPSRYQEEPRSTKEINDAYQPFGVVVTKSRFSLFKLDIKKTHQSTDYNRELRGKLAYSFLLLSFSLTRNPVALLNEYNKQLAGSQRCESISQLIDCIGALLCSDYQLGYDYLAFLLVDELDQKFTNQLVGYLREYSYVYSV